MARAIRLGKPKAIVAISNLDAAAFAAEFEEPSRALFRYRASMAGLMQAKPGMKVGEYAPGGGWYSRVLGNYLNEQGKLVGLFSCTSHLMDIGGIGFGPDATDVFMEGLYIPFLKLLDEGKVNETLMAMIRANTRLPLPHISAIEPSALR